MMLTRNSKSGRAALRTRSMSNKLQSFSKAWVVGDKVSVFFPIFWVPEVDEDGNKIIVQEVDTFGKPVFDPVTKEPVMTEAGSWDLVTANIWGHVVSDMKSFACGSAFIPSLTEVVGGVPAKILRDEHGNPIYEPGEMEPAFEPIAGDITYQFSKIAPLFVKGMKQQRLDEILSKMKGDSQSSLYKEAIAKIENEFDTSNNMMAIKPIIGKLKLKVMTDLVCVKHTATDGYDTKSAQQYSLDISDEKARAIFALLDDVKFKPRDLNTKWFEVQMTFNAASNDNKGRGEASRKAVPVGLTPEYLMMNKSKEDYARILPLLQNMSTDSEMVSRRNFASIKISERKILRCIESYILFHGDKLGYITNEEDKEMMLRSASKLVQFKAVDQIKEDSVREEIMHAYREYMEKQGESVEEDNKVLPTEKQDYQEPTFDTAPTVRDLLSSDSEFVLPGEESMYGSSEASMLM